MPKIAHVLRVERTGSNCTLSIDGKEFPYYLARTTIRSEVDPDGMGIVWVPIHAERVEVIDDLNG